MVEAVIKPALAIVLFPVLGVGALIPGVLSNDVKLWDYYKHHGIRTFMTIIGGIEHFGFGALEVAAAPLMWLRIPLRGLISLNSDDKKRVEDGNDIGSQYDVEDDNDTSSDHVIVSGLGWKSSDSLSFRASPPVGSTQQPSFDCAVAHKQRGTTVADVIPQNPALTL